MVIFNATMESKESKRSPKHLLSGPLQKKAVDSDLYYKTVFPLDFEPENILQISDMVGGKECRGKKSQGQKKEEGRLQQ